MHRECVKSDVLADGRYCQPRSQGWVAILCDKRRGKFSACQTQGHKVGMEKKKERDEDRRKYKGILLTPKHFYRKEVGKRVKIFRDHRRT